MRFVQVNDIASVASELAVALRKRGHHVDLLYPKLHGAGLSPLWKLAVAPLRSLDWLRLAWRLRQGHYDAVHIHYGYLGIVGLIARVPYVLHCHGDDVRETLHEASAPNGRGVRCGLRIADCGLRIARISRMVGRM